MITYHGSKVKITEFSLDYQVSGFYRGIYSTTDKNRVQEFGGYLYQLTLSGEYFEIKDAFHEEELIKKSGHSGSGMRLVESLIEQGFVGIKRGNEYITFNPKSIEKLSECLT